MRIGIVGNPENRRVTEFLAAASRMGFPPILVVSWQEFLDDSNQAIERLKEADCIRIETPWENAEVQQNLVRLGGGQSQLAFGEIAGMREQFEGFCLLLDRLSGGGFEFQNSPEDIKVMFDKWSSHQRFELHELKRPATFLAPGNTSEFHSIKDSLSSSGRLFIKPRYSSSASGVCAYRWSNAREQLIAPIEIERRNGSVRLFNSLKVRRYTSTTDIETILNHLLSQGMILEHWVPKARLSEGQFDLRVVVIGGHARHVVARVSSHPMTNLHLGGRRGDLNEIEKLFGTHLLSRVNRIAESAAGCFAESLYAGVDVLVTKKGEPMVCEINAFGDLLPDLYFQGETTYESILGATNDFCNPVRS